MPQRIKLGPRLNRIYDSLIEGEPVWDFCCDHGLLGTKAYLSSRFCEVHFVDPVPAIIHKLETKFREKANPKINPTRVFFWPLKGESLEVPVLGTIVIAGVGATTVLEILLGLKSRGILQAKRLLLCPQNRPEEVLEGMTTHLGSVYTRVAQINLLENSRERNVFIYDRNGGRST